jgi:hypothetical protein
MNVRSRNLPFGLRRLAPAVAALVLTVTVVWWLAERRSLDVEGPVQQLAETEDRDGGRALPRAAVLAA